MKMKNPADDVELTQGSGYMVEDGEYQAHLSDAIVIKQVSLNNHIR
jgi:hypothetical protein